MRAPAVACLLFLAQLGLLAPSSESGSPDAALRIHEFFVDALRGDDAAAGTTTATAFATVRRAQEAVRQLPRPPGVADVPPSAAGDGRTPFAIVSLRSAGTHWLHRSANASLEWAGGALLLAGQGDSGTSAGRPVVWRTHPADSGLAIVSAGLAIPGAGGAAWARSGGADPDLWQVQQVPAVAAGHVCPQQMWAGSARLPRARYPAAGFLQWKAALDPQNHTAEANSFGFVFGAEFAPVAAKILQLAQQQAKKSGSGGGGGPAGSSSLRALNITVVTMHIWGDSHSTLDSINLTARTLRWVAPSTTPVGLYEAGMPGSTGRRFFLDGTTLGLANPGSWHLDCNAGLLQYRQKPGEDVTAMDFVAAGAEEVFVLGTAAESDHGAAQALRDAMEQHKSDGITTRPLHRAEAVDPCGDPAAEVRLAARRVQLAHASNAMATADEGAASDILLENLAVAHNNFHCPTSAGSDSPPPSCGGSDGGWQKTAAIRIVHGKNVVVSGVTVTHTSSYGAWLQGGSNNTLKNLSLRELGSGGVRIGEGPIAAVGNTVSSCNISDGGHVFFAGAGIHATHTDGNLIEDNEVSGFAASGIIVRIGMWNTIRQNHVHNLGKGLLSDFGGVCLAYSTEGTTAAGNTIGHNFRPFNVSRVWCSFPRLCLCKGCVCVCVREGSVTECGVVPCFQYGAHGMYSDMCNIGSTFINNHVSGTTTAGYQMHYGWNVTVSSNIFGGGFVAAPGDSVIYANPSPSMGASFTFTNNTILHSTNATLLSVDLARSNSSKNYTFHSNRYVITSAGRPQFETRGGKADGWGDWLAIGQDRDSTCTDHGAPCSKASGRCCCCWDRSAQACNSSSQCDGGGEGCVAKGTPTAKFGPANCVCDGVSHGCPAAMKSDDQRACDPRGLARTPPVCMQPYQHQDQQGGGTAYLPNVFGGPSTLGNCAFGHFGEGGYGGGGSCWTGSLFGFSGIDGTTSVASEFVGWFVNGSYSVYLWGPARHLRLGFGPDASADPGLDTVLTATNDALLVTTKRGAATSKLGVTWRDWRTIVGFVEGPAAHVRLEELTGHGAPGGSACAVPNGCCAAVKQFQLPSDSSVASSPRALATDSEAVPHKSFRYWRWEIEKTHDGSGSTICYIGFELDGRWATDPKWNVSGAFHSFHGGQPANVLTRDCGSFWNSAVSATGPWNLTIDTAVPIAPTGFEYSIYVPGEAPLQFAVLGASAQTGPWETVFSTAAAPNSGCAPHKPPPPPPPYWADPAIRGVDVTSDTGHWTLAFATSPSEQVAGRTEFALCYNEQLDRNHSTVPGAVSCAAAAVTAPAAGGSEAVMAKRNAFILETLPPLPDPGDDRFQRKLLSVMKVNSMSPEGAVKHAWSTTCRAPHKWMYLWDGMHQTLSMSHVPNVGPPLARDYIRAFFQFQQPNGHLCSIISPPAGASAHSCSTDASVPNVAMAVLDNYQQGPDRAFLAEVFPKLERYIQWDVFSYGRDGIDKPADGWNASIRYLLRWHNAGDAGMDHEQNFCPGGSYWHGPQRCSADHYALDFANYVIWEAQALAKIANELQLPAREAYWNSLAANVTREMDEYMWDEDTGMHYDLYPNGSRTSFKTVAAFYPLMSEGMNATKIARIVANLKSKDFWTAVPVPTVAVSTPDFSSDLDRGPMVSSCCCATCTVPLFRHSLTIIKTESSSLSYSVGAAEHVHYPRAAALRLRQGGRRPQGGVAPNGSRLLREMGHCLRVL